MEFLQKRYLTHQVKQWEYSMNEIEELRERIQQLEKYESKGEEE